MPFVASRFKDDRANGVFHRVADYQGNPCAANGNGGYIFHRTSNNEWYLGWQLNEDWVNGYLGGVGNKPGTPNWIPDDMAESPAGTTTGDWPPAS